MKKAILFFLCCGLVMCSACNKAEPPPTEKQIITASETKTTESETDTSPVIDNSITAEKSAPVESKQVETSSVAIIKDEPQKIVKIYETSESPQETNSTPIEGIVEQVIADSGEVERLVVEYINEFRVAQDDI